MAVDPIIAHAGSNYLYCRHALDAMLIPAHCQQCDLEVPVSACVKCGRWVCRNCTDWIRHNYATLTCPSYQLDDNRCVHLATLFPRQTPLDDSACTICLFMFYRICEHLVGPMAALALARDFYGLAGEIYERVRDRIRFWEAMPDLAGQHLLMDGPKMVPFRASQLYGP